MVRSTFKYQFLNVHCNSPGDISYVDSEIVREGDLSGGICPRGEYPEETFYILLVSAANLVRAWAVGMHLTLILTLT